MIKPKSLIFCFMKQNNNNTNKEGAVFSSPLQQQHPFSYQKKSLTTVLCGISDTLGINDVTMQHHIVDAIGVANEIG